MRLLDASHALSVVPPMLLGFTHHEAGLGDVFLDHEQQRARDASDVGEVGKHHQRHELELLAVWVLVVARLVVHHPGREVLVVDDEQVGNAAHPHLLVHEPARLQVLGHAHLVLAQFPARFGHERIKRSLQERKLRRQGRALLDVQLRCRV